MEQITISQNDRQQINILSNEPQFIRLSNNNPQDININLNKNQDVNIKNSDNQILYVEETGSVVGISDVLVNGVSVVSNNIAYIIVPTKTSELINDSGYITSENDPTVPYYIKQITLADINSWNNKQDLLVSGTNIKTLNDESLLGSGNIEIDIPTYTAGEGIDITDYEISNTITSYNDLTDLPTIPTQTSQLENNSDFVTTDELSDVAFSGSYTDLSNAPDIPTDTSDLINDSGFIDKDVNDLTYYTLSSNLSAVATSGDYDDLTNKPTIPTNTSDLSNDSGFISDSDYASYLHGGVIKSGINSYDINASGYLYADTQTYTDYGSLANTNFIGKGTLENVLTGKGYITNTVNDLTNYTLSSNLSTVATSGNYSDLSGTPTIPTNTSDLTNDSGFITNSVNNLSNYTLTSTLTTWNSRASNITIQSGYTLQENRTYANEGIKLCYVHINVKATSTSGDIATGLPKALESMTLYAMNGTTLTPVLVWVRSNGSLACYTPHAVNDDIKVSGCYPYSSL